MLPLTKAPIAGIDYGAKKAGTTVVASLSGDDCTLFSVPKNKDADRELVSFFENETHSLIAIDAPLSLPSYYSDASQKTKLSVNETNYFYRKGDIALKAMSPLFLGGLTARAIKLKDTLIEQYSPNKIIIKETYPAQQARRIDLKDYKKNLTTSYQHLQQIINEELQKKVSYSQINNWHQLDATLALLSAIRIAKDKQIVYGDEQEGAIYI